MTMALLVGQTSISMLPFVKPTSLSFKPLTFTKTLTLPSAHRPSLTSTTLRLNCKMESDSDILRVSTCTVTMLMELAVLLMANKCQIMDAASSYLRRAGETHDTVRIQTSVGNGPGCGQAWGCDLSYDYVKINAEYTT